MNPHNLPGPGDEATWGPVVSPQDPRYVQPPPTREEIEEIRTRGLGAMDHVVDVVRAPLVSRWDIEQAIKELQKALPAAAELDPPQAA